MHIHFDFSMTSYKNLTVDFRFRIQKSPSPYHILSKIKRQYPGKYASFFTFLFCDTFITRGCHGTLEINENCHYVQNDPHRCKINIEKFHFYVMGLLRKVSQGSEIRQPPPPPPACQIGLRYAPINDIWQENCTLFEIMLSVNPAI